MTSARPILSLIASGDHRLMRRVHRWNAPRAVRLSSVAATRAGDGWLWAALGAVLLLAGGAERFRAIAAAASAAAAGILLFVNLKKVARRSRPCEFEPHRWATLAPPDEFSFPSGHTITAFAVAVSLGAFYPALLGALLFCAVGVAASRIVLGMHFLTDVLAGAALGIALGCAAAAIFA